VTENDARGISMSRDFDRAHLAHADPVSGSLAAQRASHRKIRIARLRDGGAFPVGLRQ
jgi:hypothetical protein